MTNVASLPVPSGFSVPTAPQSGMGLGSHVIGASRFIQGCIIFAEPSHMGTVVNGYTWGLSDACHSPRALAPVRVITAVSTNTDTNEMIFFYRGGSQRLRLEGGQIREVSGS